MTKHFIQQEIENLDKFITECNKDNDKKEFFFKGFNQGLVLQAKTSRNFLKFLQEVMEEEIKHNES